MTTYMITSSAGLDMGVYTAETALDALDALARDAGYHDHDHAGGCDWTERQADEGAEYDRLITLL